MDTNIISIVVPVKNRAILIRQTIESVLQQSCPAWELIVVDDHSEDDTAAVVLAYAQKDQRIHYFLRQSSHSGASVCRNEGVARISGFALLFLDSDDLLAPWCVENRLKALAAQPAVDMLVNQGEIFKKSPGDMEVLYNRLDFDDDLEHFLLHDNPWCVIGPTWRRNAFLKVGAWDESLLSWQDWDQHVRALAAGLNIIKCPAVDYYTRSAAGRLTISSTSNCYDHICRQLACCKKIYGLLASKGRMTNCYRKLLAGNLFRLCRSMVPTFYARQAFLEWKSLRAEHLVSTSCFMVGVLALLIDSCGKKAEACCRRISSIWLRCYFKESAMIYSSDSYYKLPKDTALEDRQ